MDGQPDRTGERGQLRQDRINPCVLNPGGDGGPTRGFDRHPRDSTRRDVSGGDVDHAVDVGDRRRRLKRAADPYRFPGRVLVLHLRISVASDRSAPMRATQRRLTGKRAAGWHHHRLERHHPRRQRCDLRGEGVVTGHRPRCRRRQGVGQPVEAGTGVRVKLRESADQRRHAGFVVRFDLAHRGVQRFVVGTGGVGGGQVGDRRHVRSSRPCEAARRTGRYVG
jgi:hypothetical protein